MKNNEKQRILEEITTKNNEFCKYYGKSLMYNKRITIENI